MQRCVRHRAAPTGVQHRHCVPVTSSPAVLDGVGCTTARAAADIGRGVGPNGSARHGSRSAGHGAAQHQLGHGDGVAGAQTGEPVLRGQGARAGQAPPQPGVIAHDPGLRHSRLAGRSTTAGSSPPRCRVGPDHDEPPWDTSAWRTNPAAARPMTTPSSRELLARRLAPCRPDRRHLADDPQTGHGRCAPRRRWPRHPCSSAPRATPAAGRRGGRGPPPWPGRTRSGSAAGNPVTHRGPGVEARRWCPACSCR